MKWLHGGLVRTHRRDHPQALSTLLHPARVDIDEGAIAANLAVARDSRGDAHAWFVCRRGTRRYPGVDRCSTRAGHGVASAPRPNVASDRPRLIWKERPNALRLLKRLNLHHRTRLTRY